MSYFESCAFTIQLKNILTYVGISLMLMSSTVFSSGDYTEFPPPPTAGISLPPFYKISCTNNLAVRLSGTQGVSSLRVTHQPINKELVSEVVNGTLYLSMKKQQEDKPASNEAMTISLQTGSLKEIAVSGNCEIDGAKIQGYGMELIGLENGRIYLEGDVKISKILAQNQSFIEVVWADSPQLFLNTFDTSLVKIAGIANEVFLRANGNSTIDAQYLRTCRVNVFAKNQGFAQVLPLCELRAFAEGRSRIDYYTVPRDAMAVTQSSGNVLWLGYRN